MRFVPRSSRDHETLTGSLSKTSSQTLSSSARFPGQHALETLIFCGQKTKSESRDLDCDKGLERLEQLLRNTLGFSISARADHVRPAGQEKIASSENFVIEAEANFSNLTERNTNLQLIIVSGGVQIFEAAFSDLKNCVLPLKRKATEPDLPKEFTTRDFEKIQVTRVVDVIPQSTVRIADAHLVACCFQAAARNLRWGGRIGARLEAHWTPAVFPDLVHGEVWMRGAANSDCAFLWRRGSLATCVIEAVCAGGAPWRDAP